LTLDQRATIEQLKDTDPDKYAQLGEARFIKSGGAFFKEFTRDIHVIEPFVISEDWTRYRSIDYGLDKLAVLWFAVAPDNTVYCYKELHEENLIVSKACERIKQVNGSDIIRATYNPSDLQSRTKDTGVQITELFKQNGVNLTQSSNKRVQGWLSVKEAIKVFETRSVDTGLEIKDSKLKIFNNCETLIKYIQQIKTSESDPNDVADTPHELTHINDALRYFAVTRFTTYQEKETKPKHDPYNDYVNEITSW
jgi:phage terminase large subunit